MRQRETSNQIMSKEGVRGQKEAGKGFGYIIRGTSDALLNTLLATAEITRWGIDKLKLKSGSQDPDIISSRQKIAKHHLNQSKKSISKAGGGLWQATKGIWHAGKGSVRTVFGSGKDAINGLRKNNKSNKDKNDN